MKPTKSLLSYLTYLSSRYISHRSLGLLLRFHWYESTCTYANKNANVALLVVSVVTVVDVIVVLGLPINATSIAAILTPKRKRASRDRIKRTGEY